MAQGASPKTVVEGDSASSLSSLSTSTQSRRKLQHRHQRSSRTTRQFRVCGCTYSDSTRVKGGGEGRQAPILGRWGFLGGEPGGTEMRGVWGREKDGWRRRRKFHDSSGLRLFPPYQEPKRSPPLHEVENPLIPLPNSPFETDGDDELWMTIILFVDLHLHTYTNKSPSTHHAPNSLAFLQLILHLLTLVKDILLSYMSRPLFNTRRRGENGEQTWEKPETPPKSLG